MPAFAALSQLVPGETAVDGVVNVLKQTPKTLRCLGVLAVAPIQRGVCHLCRLISRIQQQRFVGPACGFIQLVFTFQ